MLRTKKLVATTVAVVASAVLLQCQARGQELKGQLKLGWHEVKLDAGKLYEFSLHCPDDFDLTVDMVEAPLNIVLGDDPKDDRYFYLPNTTDKYRLFVLPGIGIPKQATFNYTLKVKTVPLAKKPLLETKSKLTAKDPTYKQDWERHFKAFKVELKAGKMYVIDMIDDGVALDPYLFLEDATGKSVAQDDDSGGDLNARIIYSPMKTGDFRIIATTLEKATGSFTLRVRQEE